MSRFLFSIELLLERSSNLQPLRDISNPTFSATIPFFILLER